MRIFPSFLLASALALVASAQTYTIQAVAGGGLPENQQAKTTPIGAIQNTVMDAAGNIYLPLPDYNVVVRIDSNGYLTRFAGNGKAATAGDGGAAKAAALNAPTQMALDSKGNAYIVTSLSPTDHRSIIRRVDVATGIITTVAGGGPCCNPWPNPDHEAPEEPQNAVGASIGMIQGITVDKSGLIYMTTKRYVSGNSGPDRGSRIMRLDLANNSVRGLTHTPPTGPNLGLVSPKGIATNGDGFVYVVDQEQHSIFQIDPATSMHTRIAGNLKPGFFGDNAELSASVLQYPEGIAFDANANLYFADVENYRIRMAEQTTGTVHTIAGYGMAGTFGDGWAATAAQLTRAQGVMAGPDGTFYIADAGNRNLRKVTKGIIDTAAGGAGLATGTSVAAAEAQIDYPTALATDKAGTVYVANGRQILRVADGKVTVVTAIRQPGFDGSVAVDTQGTLYFGDKDTVVRHVNGTDQVVAGGGDNAADFTWRRATSVKLPPIVRLSGGPNNEIYIASKTQVFKFRPLSGDILLYAGKLNSATFVDGMPAINAAFGPISGMTVDPQGNVFVVDSGSWRIRRIDAVTGAATTLAGLRDCGSCAGQSPTALSFGATKGIASDRDGNLFITRIGYDFAAIERFDRTTGIVSIIAGTTERGQSGDGGLATAATLMGPADTAVDSLGRVYIADRDGNRIRVLVPPNVDTPGAVNVPVLALNLSHTGNFTRGDMHRSYSIAVSNISPATPTSGEVIVSESLPGDLHMVSMMGEGWNCTGAKCRRQDALPAGGTYPPITVSVLVDLFAALKLTNYVTVTGGGSTGTDASDTTIILPAPSATPITASLVSAAAPQLPAAIGGLAVVKGNLAINGTVRAAGAGPAPYLGDWTFWFGSATNAPIFYVAPKEALIQVPWTAKNESGPQLFARMEGRMLISQVVGIAEYSPALFSTNGTGSGQGQIANPNGQLADTKHPAAKGSVVTIYCTGLGAVTNQPATGAPAVANQSSTTLVTPTVTMDGADALVVSSGLVPGTVGLYQIQAQVPKEIGANNFVAVVVHMGDKTSNKVTMSVGEK